MKTLIIAEKPSVARDLAVALGGFQKGANCYESGQAIISYAFGHLVQLSGSTKNRQLESLPIIPDPFELEVIESSKAQFHVLKDFLSRSDVSEVVNACDAGREGEHIFRQIVNKAVCTKPMTRMWLSSMTPDAMRKAYKDRIPSTQKDALGKAAWCRDASDWIVGINLTIAISAYYERLQHKRELVSIGRVQTPTLSMLAQRELEILNFKPQSYWEVHATFNVAAGDYVAKWVNPAISETIEIDDEDAPLKSNEYRITDQSTAKKIVSRCTNKPTTKITEDIISTKQHAPALFDLTTLQRTASKLYKLSAQQTLNTAQSLYEKHKAISYPRTDSCALPDDYVDPAKQVMAALSKDKIYADHAQRVLTAGWIKSNKQIFNSAEVTDHFAIIPTDHLPTNLSDIEQKIYQLIVLRFIAVFHDPAVWNNTTRRTWIEQDQFKATGRVLSQPGWLAVYEKSPNANSSKPADKLLCTVVPDETITNGGIALKSLKTTAPKRYTEDTLLGVMKQPSKFVSDEDLKSKLKEKGLGTPATRAGIIETLLADKDSRARPRTPYVKREKGNLVPTAHGIAVIDFLKTCQFEILTSPILTGQWEQKLADIEHGKGSAPDFMKGIGQLTTSMILEIQRQCSEIQVPILKASCPSCENVSALKLEGSFVNCSHCDFAMRREVAGHILSTPELEQLFGHGHTDPLEGFYNSTKKTKFSACLKLVDQKIEFFHPPGMQIEPPCPTCGGNILLYKRFAKCSSESCNFTVWRETAGNTLTDATIIELIKNGSTPPLKGFLAKDKKTRFSAALCIKEGKVAFQIEQPRPFTETCPTCQNALTIDGRAVKCTTCEFKLWRTVAQKNLSEDDMKNLIKNGSTGLLDGFLKKDGTTAFTASLKLAEGKVVFDFPPKAP